MVRAPDSGARTVAARMLACAIGLSLPVAGAPLPVWTQSFPNLPGGMLSMGQPAEVPRAPLLTIDRDVLYRDSAFGQRLQDDLLDASRELAEENRRIEAELTARELELTEQRASLELEAFRALADAFDARVTRIRAEQDAKARALQRRREQERQSFFTAALPILSEIVREAGAVAVLDRGSVFLTADEIDITSVAIRRLDRSLGDGSTLTLPAPDAEARPAPRPGAGAGQGANTAPADTGPAGSNAPAETAPDDPPPPLPDQ